MEQLNLVWKNYTASLSRNFDDEFFSNDQDDGKIRERKEQYWSACSFHLSFFFLVLQRQMHLLVVNFITKSHFGSVLL